MAWIKKMCDDYCISESHLAKKSKINQSTLTTIKKNKTSIGSIKADNLEKISKAIGATMEETKRWYK